MKKYLFSILFLFIFIPVYAKAATLSLEAPKDTYHLGDSFTVKISLDVDDVCVNTIEARISFPTGILSIEDFVTGDSLINVWVEQPSGIEIFDANDKGELYIAGGIPGGYCGKIPGDPGDSNIIGKILFKIPGFYVGDSIPDKLAIKFSEAKVYVNDGLGTLDRLKKKILNLNLEKTTGADVGDYNLLVKSDKIKPEPFVIEINRNDNVYQGQYYAVFISADKQSGIDHYEILEAENVSVKKTLTEQLYNIFIKEQKTEWKIAKIPYLLEDQSLRSVIKVKAIDRAGNEREVEYIPAEPNVRKVLDYDYLIITLAVLLLILLIILFYKVIRFFFQKHKKKKDSVEDFHRTVDKD